METIYDVVPAVLAAAATVGLTMLFSGTEKNRIITLFIIVVATAISSFLLVEHHAYTVVATYDNISVTNHVSCVEILGRTIYCRVNGVLDPTSVDPNWLLLYIYLYATTAISSITLLFYSIQVVLDRLKTRNPVGGRT